jgi:hypothetical protein
MSASGSYGVTGADRGGRRSRVSLPQAIRSTTFGVRRQHRCGQIAAGRVVTTATPAERKSMVRAAAAAGS